MTSSAQPDWAARLDRVRVAIGALDLDALVVSTPNNIAYLTGFTGSAGLLVVESAGDAWLLVDGRYQTSVREGLSAGTLARVRPWRVPLRYETALVDRLRQQGATRVGFEAAQVTVATLRDWGALAPSVTWRATEAIVERLRSVKDAAEIAILRRGATALSDVARRLPSFLQVEATEREVARRIDRALEEVGFQKPAFDTIVAAGDHSAHPHARPTDRRLKAGDLVLLDFGGVLDGYCVDLTRMAGIGQMPVTILSLYEAVRAAQDAAIAAVRHGVLGSDVDRAARAMLESRGLGEAFSHGTGHGLGRDVHEAPRLGRADSGPSASLEAGMVCTIEPGAYLEGLGGVRLEDDVLVTATGCEVLTDAPRELMVV